MVHMFINTGGSCAYFAIPETEILLQYMLLMLEFPYLSTGQGHNTRNKGIYLYPLQFLDAYRIIFAVLSILTDT